MTYVKLEDAVKALEELYDDGSSIDGSINCDDAIEALRSLPTDDGVTDEMVERAAQAWLEKASDYELLEVSIRAALEAALDRTKSELANIGKQ